LYGLPLPADFQGRRTAGAEGGDRPLPQGPEHTMSTRVKFCGLTRGPDVLAAIECGVHALGFNLARGPRRIGLEQAAELCRLVPPMVATVALFVDADEEGMLSAAARLRASALQLHGQESPELCERLRRRFPVIKAFAVGDRASLEAVRGFPADAYLLDTAGAGGSGGSGMAWDHRLLAGLDLGRPLILAGGLDAGNVAAAVRATRPWAVDVASGIESGPGIKDPLRMAAFMAALAAAHLAGAL
jgi:phosphoribosylanthranilate isomerase